MPYEFKSYYFDDPIVDGRVMDIMLPRSVQQPLALFFIHGGGWTEGSRANYHAIMRAFNQEGFICAATDYRLCAPGITILDQLTDIRHGYVLFAELLKNLDRPVRIITHGSSAGAHLTALLSLATPGQCGESKVFRAMNITDWIAPAAAVLQATPVFFEPWEDIFPHIWTAMQMAMGESYEKHPELYHKVAPYRYISAASCPVFFMEAECEHMFPLKYIIQFTEKMRSLGRRAEYKIYKNAEHGFFYDVTRRQQKEAFADILKFIHSLPAKE